MAKKGTTPKGNTNNKRRTKTQGTLKNPKGKKQYEGESRETGETSDNRNEIAPNSNLHRGIGSSFAYAVGAIMQAVPDLKGSQTDFLGEPSEVIDPKQFAHSLIKGK